MAFPASPSDNQVHKTGDRTFVYDSTLGVWDQLKEANPQETGSINNTTLGSGVTGGAALTPAASYAHFWHAKPSGQDGGTATAGSFNTRLLNNSTISMTGCSLSNNQITLPAGTYFCTGFAPSRDVDGNKARLQNITNGSTLILGSTALCADAYSGFSESWMLGVFVLTGTKVLEVQHRVTTTKTTFGLGGQVSFGVEEIFTQIQFLKIG